MTLVLLLVFNLLIWTGFYWFFRRRIDHKMGSQELLKEVQDEVDALVKELNLTSERNIGVLEERLVRLESLIRSADQRLTLWAKEEEKRAQPLVYSKLKPASEKALPEKVLPAKTLSEKTPEPTLQEKSSREIPSVSSLVSQVATPVVEAESPPTSLRERVLLARAQGLSSGEIAQKFGVTQAEVELILSLYPLRS
ncbi:MAG: hypothetical protein HKM05_08975 [Spirochaetales bacterium]|nr:hypothetical protein [Spirochaetales bacterium]